MALNPDAGRDHDGRRFETVPVKTHGSADRSDQRPPVINKGLDTPRLEEPVGHAHRDAPAEEAGEMITAQVMSTGGAVVNPYLLEF